MLQEESRLQKHDDELQRIEMRLSQLQERKKEIERKRKQIERKARTKRLIETGALIEKYFEIEHLSIEEREELLKVFATYIKSNMPNKFKKNESR